ncbi:MAG: Sec-independent protein translocase subunit TatA [Methylococcales bacterium]|nr:Sec-independent protein translocase subunit TatA [Methylococcales bacterium]
MGISVTQLAIILVIVVVLFGTKRLRNIGGDLGGAIKGFRSAIKEGSEEIDELEEISVQQRNSQINTESTLENVK